MIGRKATCQRIQQVCASDRRLQLHGGWNFVLQCRQFRIHLFCNRCNHSHGIYRLRASGRHAVECQLKGIGMLSLWNDVDDLFLRLPVHPVNRTDDAGTDCRSSDSLVTTKELTLFPAKGNHDADGRYSMPWVARGQGVEVLVLVFRSQRSPEGSRSVEVRANIGGYFVDL